MMFWKNIQQPPAGSAELASHRNFLGWAQAFQKRTEAMGSEMKEAVKEMMAVEKRLLPGGQIQPIRADKKTPSDKFIILHGKRGFSGGWGRKIARGRPPNPLDPSSTMKLLP